MPHIEIAAERIGGVLGIPITNSLVTGWFVTGVLIALALLLSKQFKIVPAALQNIGELFVEKFLALMENTFGSRKKAEKYLPLIATIFIFILGSNWLGIFPGVGSIGFTEIKDGVKNFVPLFRSAASDLNFTLSLAMLTVIVVNILGVVAVGMGKHFSKYFSLKNPIYFAIGILEFVSEFAKIISFSFRLFGNVFAGEVLLTISTFLVPLVAPIPFLGLEIFVGFIQALVFAMLTMVFVSIAVVEQH